MHTVLTGQNRAFTFNGAFNGGEKLYWSDDKSCTTCSSSCSDIGTLIPDSRGTLASTNEMVFEGLRPQTLSLCYDYGNPGDYRHVMGVELIIQGFTFLGQLLFFAGMGVFFEPLKQIRYPQKCKNNHT